MSFITIPEGAHFTDRVGGGVKNRYAEVAQDYANAAFAIVTNTAPSPREVSPLERVNPQMAAEYAQMAGDFAGARFSSYVGHSQQGGQYAVYNELGSIIRRTEMSPLAPGAEYDEVREDVKFEKFAAEVRGARRVVADQTRANEESNTLQRAIRFLTELSLRDLESRIHAAIGAKTNWMFNADGVDSATVAGFNFADDSKNDISQWNRHGNTAATQSDPVGDIMHGMEVVGKATNRTPDTLLITPPVKRALLTHPRIISRVGPGTPGLVNPALEHVATLTGLRQIVESKMVTQSGGYLFGNNAILAYVPQTKSMDEPSAIMRVGWTGLQGAAPDGVSMRTVRAEQRDADMVLMRTAWDIVQQSTSLGVFFSNIVA